MKPLLRGVVLSCSQLSPICIFWEFKQFRFSLASFKPIQAKKTTKTVFQPAPEILSSGVALTFQAQSVQRPQVTFPGTNRKNSYCCINIARSYCTITGLSLVCKNIFTKREINWVFCSFPACNMVKLLRVFYVDSIFSNIAVFRKEILQIIFWNFAAKKEIELRYCNIEKPNENFPKT